MQGGKRMQPSRKSMLLLLALRTVGVADPIPIPNFSFELPAVTRDIQNPFGALPFIADWDETDVGLADELNQNTGVFLNTAVGEPDHITNAEQKQLAFLSSLTGNAVRQELADTYIPDRSYTFTVGVAKSNNFHGFPVGDTEQLEIALFYFNHNVEQIVASTFVSGSQVNSNSLIDVTLISPVVAVGDAWAGKQIGVLVRPSITDPDEDDGEGFWDVDNARLDVSPPIMLFPDAAIMAHCMAGLDVTVPPAGCTPEEFERADLDADSDVDLLDYAEFQTLFGTH